MRLLLSILFTISSLSSCPVNDIISVGKDSEGYKLYIKGEPFFVQGMNWDYFPIGTNYEYILWNQSDDFIKKALDSEMTLLKDIGVNAIRVYTGIPARWIEYIYEEYGIYTMLNHSFGRYGLTLDGQWVANTDYADSRTEKLLLNEILLLATEYKDTPGLLMYLLGNENNYGLFWSGAETEDIPVENRASTKRALAMYKLFNKAAQKIKAIDTLHPVVLCNGDLQFLDIIATECRSIDILGVNMYRGSSFTDAFSRTKTEIDKPLLFTEFGADAYDFINKKEDQVAQAKYVIHNWKEIYSNAAGLGQSNNCIGGFTFQMSDGWWKFGQQYNLDVHDDNASWGNGGYSHDFIEGQNNMNEEWFGICAKGPTSSSGHYVLTPRKAYHALKALHQIDPYLKEQTAQKISSACDNIEAVMFE